MNIGMIRYILGKVTMIVGAILLIPCICAVWYREKEGIVYIITSLSLILFGFLISMVKPKNMTIYLKEGLVATSLSWIFMSIFGAIPLCLTGEIPSFIDALFESVSGFTTTGASILSDVEALSHTSLMWRSTTHLIGGMGVLVFLLAVIPTKGGSQVNLMKAESPGPTVGKLVPKLRQTAKILYLIYIGLVVLEIIFLLCGGYTLFESVNTAFATAGTGGFGIKNDSLGSFSLYGKWVVAVFMLLFGVNFNFYYFIIMRQFRKGFEMSEVRVYLAIIAVSTTIIAINIRHLYESVGLTITDSFFQVLTVMTTTGFSTTDFDLWPTTSKLIMFLLMFCGACAGSTGGGIKVSRFIIIIKTLKKEMNSLLHPKNIKKIQSDGKTIDHDTVRSVNVYFVAFTVLFVISALIISLEGYNLTTTLSAVAATINNIGPGFDAVGPTCNFGGFTILSKLVFVFDMLAGRLEIFPILILFHPLLYKNIYASAKNDYIEPIRSK